MLALDSGYRAFQRIVGCVSSIRRDNYKLRQNKSKSDQIIGQKDHEALALKLQAPIAVAILASASAWVVQVMLVPGLLTNGSAAQVRVAAHGESTNFPPTHCANAPSTHACAPSWQEDEGVRLANWVLRACASLPFWALKSPPAVPLPVF